MYSSTAFVREALEGENGCTDYCCTDAGRYIVFEVRSKVFLQGWDKLQAIDHEEGYTVSGWMNTAVE